MNEEIRNFLKVVASYENGRWLDSTGTECEEDTPDAEWTTYDLREQCEWLETLASQAEGLLERMST